MFMENPLRRRYSFPLILLIILALLGVTGCTKQRASYYVNRAKKRVQAAKTNEAARFQADELKKTEAAIVEAQKQIDQQSFQSALDAGRQAGEAARALLEATITARAQTLKGEADKDVSVARENGGEQLNKTLFDQIVKNNEAAIAALTKSKYEKTIQLCLQVATDNKALLQTLREEAEKNIGDSKNRFEKLKREGAPTEAPDFVTDAEARIKTLQTMISYPDRQYLKARQVYQDIVRVTDEGITAARKSRSEKKIAELEKRLTKAIAEEAETYMNDMLINQQETYKDILKNFYPPVQDYAKVLQAADLLLPQVEELILQTRILAATDKINKVKSAIRYLAGNNVREYLPGRVEKMEEYLVQAEGLFAKDQFDETKETCRVALEEQDMILKDFNEFAAAEIRTAGGNADQATALLQQMGNIFAVQSPASTNPNENAFENSKKALKSQLDTMVRDAQVTLSAANSLREDKEYSKSIQSARLVVSRTNYAIREIYHVVAHNNAMELAHQLAEVEKNGGAKFARAELDQASKQLVDARAMIKDMEVATASQPKDANPDSYRDAVSKTSEAKSSIEVALQRVTQAAVAKIADAEKILAEARKNKADVYALGDLTTARTVMEQANQALSEGKLLDSANQADKAQNLGSQANVKSAQSWAKETISGAEGELEKAKAATADTYAADRYKESLNQLNTAKELFNSAANSGDPNKAAADFIAGKDVAGEAGKNAVEARMKPITKANQDIVTAKRYEGWERNYPLVAESIIDARTSLEAMQAGNYGLAKAIAEQASQKATKAAELSKNESHAERVSKVEKDLTKAAASGSQYFSVEELRKMMGRLKDIREKYTSAQFESISAELDKYETDLFKMIEQTPETYKTLLAAQRAVYDNLVSIGSRDFADAELREADRLLRYSDIDYGKKNYRSAYENLKKGNRTLMTVMVQYQERDFINQARNLFVDLEQTMKIIKPILTLRPAMLHTLLKQPGSKQSANAVLMGSDPIKFRQGMDALYKKSLIIAHPVTMNAQYSDMVKVIDLARQSSFQFEKLLILDQYDGTTAKEVVDKGYMLINKSLQTQSDLGKQFEQKGLQGKLQTFQHVIGG